MKIPKHLTLIERMLTSRLKKLVPQRPLLGASLVEVFKKCGRSGCRCERGEKHPKYFLTYKVKTKTKTVYVPVDLVQEVRQWIKEHRRLKKLMQETSQLSLARVRTHVQARKRKANRS